MCNFASLFRILLAVSVILPFADAIAQTSPAPAQASPSTAPPRDVTGRWDFRACDSHRNFNETSYRLPLRPPERFQLTWMQPCPIA
jgi:hypothetical protein